MNINIQKLKPYVEGKNNINRLGPNNKGIVRTIQSGFHLANKVKMVLKNGTSIPLTNDQKYLIAFTMSQVRDGQAYYSGDYWTPPKQYVHAQSSKNSKGKPWISTVGTNEKGEYYIQGGTGRISKLKGIYKPRNTKQNKSVYNLTSPP